MAADKLMKEIWSTKDEISAEMNRDPAKWFRETKKREALLRKQGFRFARVGKRKGMATT